jgi:hypothetical protein
MMDKEEILAYVRKRVQEIENDMDEWGFGPEDMDEWTQGNYEAYKHLFTIIIGTKE